MGGLGRAMAGGKGRGRGRGGGGADADAAAPGGGEAPPASAAAAADAGAAGGKPEEKAVTVPCSVEGCNRTTYSRTGNPVMCPCCRSRKSRAKRKRERQENGGPDPAPSRRAARGGGPTAGELRMLRSAVAQQEAALAKTREALAKLEGRADPPAEGAGAGGEGLQN